MRIVQVFRDRKKSPANGGAFLSIKKVKNQSYFLLEQQLDLPVAAGFALAVLAAAIGHSGAPSSGQSVAFAAAGLVLLPHDAGLQFALSAHAAGLQFALSAHAAAIGQPSVPALLQSAGSHWAAVALAFTLDVLLHPTTAKPRMATRVRVKRCFIVIFLQKGVKGGITFRILDCTRFKDEKQRNITIYPLLE